MHMGNHSRHGISMSKVRAFTKGYIVSCLFWYITNSRRSLARAKYNCKNVILNYSAWPFYGQPISKNTMYQKAPSEFDTVIAVLTHNYCSKYSIRHINILLRFNHHRYNNIQIELQICSMNKAKNNNWASMHLEYRQLLFD